MGSPDTEPKRKAHEGPVFEVEIAPFWMSQYEVTWSEYREYMRLYSVFKEFETRNLREVNENNKQDAITAPTRRIRDDPASPLVT